MAATRVRKVTQAQAEQALAAVKRQFAAYFEPATFEDGFTVAGSAPPKLVMDFDWTGTGPGPAIVWKEGPYEWAYLACAGGVDEEMAELAAEVGVTVRAQDPVKMPEAIWCEPTTSWALALYPRD